MKKKLVIYLQRQTTPFWSVGQGTHHGDIEALSQAAREREVIVLVPAEDVLLTVAKLPKMSKSRLLQALPYALEEQLIPDVESLHFAAMPYQENGTIPVAVVAHDKMQTWVNQLTEYGVTPDRLLPVNLALPTDVDTWHAMISSNGALVRTSEYAGFVCDNNNFVDFMQVALAESEVLPNTLVLQNYTNHAFSDALKGSVAIREDFLDPTTFLDNLFLELGSGSSIDLLQGQYAPKRSRMPHLQVGWKIAVYLAIAWVGLLFVNPIVSGFILSHRESALSADIQKIYKEFFPQSTSVVAPKQRIEEKLRSFSAKAGENRLFQELLYIGQGMQEAKSLKLKRVDYHDTQLTAELSASTPEELEHFIAYLSKQGLEVKQQNADLGGSRISATLVIR